MNKIFKRAVEKVKKIWVFFLGFFQNIPWKSIFTKIKKWFVSSAGKIKPGFLWIKKKVNNIKWQKIGSKLKVFLSKIIKFVKKNKKTIGIIIFALGYIFFWWWFFNERDIAIDDKNIEQKQIVKVDKKETDKNNNKKEENKKEFKELGNFWIEINTDKVKIKAPIVNGVTPDKLDQGVGHHKTTAWPNRDKGNVVLSGHRWKRGNNPAYTVFEDLDKLKKGDKITVHYGNKEFVYEVFDHKTVGSKAVEILKQTDEPILTLYTCTPKYTALKRLVYKARLLK